MNRRIRNLWIKGLCGSGEAYRRLGIIFLKGTGCGRDRRLARLCMREAAILGDETGYFLYHRIFSRGRKVIDDNSYRDMKRAYALETDLREKRRLKKYLGLGTRRQRNI